MRATLLCMGLAVLAAGCATLDRQPLAFSELAYAGADGAAWAARALPLPALQAAEGLATPLTMHAVEAGPAEGPPVVLLHDVGGYASVWRAQIASLAGAGQRVIALDLIGHGKSSKPGAFS
ncbi:MAG: alpha/beta fold hydrolase, partial [Myxococcales bacterium]|nr:alpha/beta fold hydrolase [Myxococcales bacterium]